MLNLNLRKILLSLTDCLQLRSKLSKIRLNSLNEECNSLVKVAFDTRRIDQENDYIPRRNLQNYHRSDPFISQATAYKITLLNKLRNVSLGLKDKYGKEPDWQDSYARILLSTLDKTLRVDFGDGDYAEIQPSIGSVDYITQLLDVRYRLNMDNIKNASIEELEKIILSKDEKLTNKSQLNKTEVNFISQAITPILLQNKSSTSQLPVLVKQENIRENSDLLIEKLFGNLTETKASKDNPEVERSLTITFKDLLKK